MLKSIHESSQYQCLNPLPSDASLLEDLGITHQSIREESLEEFFGKCLLLAEANIKDLYKLLESQGFDIWLKRIFYPSFIIPDASNKRITI